MNNKFTKNKIDDFIFYTDNRLTNFGVKHAFTTKFGGVSKGYFSSLNLSLTRNDDINDVLNNYKIVSKYLDLNYNRITITAQTHTKNVVVVDETNVGSGILKPSFKDVDALVTNLKDTPVFAFFADCVPIILYDFNKKVISVVHSGWKGTALEIVRFAVSKMISMFNSNPTDIIASIGPSISQKNFEIDKLTMTKLSTIKNAKDCIIQNNDKYYADLWTLNKNILLDSKIPEENIEIIDICTVDNADIFYSHRVSGDKRGNFAAIASL